MLSITCADFSLPLCFIQSISWTKKARTIQYRGGYVSSRGFEPTEISLKIQVSEAICSAFGYKSEDIFEIFNNLVTSRTGLSGVFYVGGYPIYPEVEFALTNINKTTVNDRTGITTYAEADLIFSGVKAVKNVVRERALELDPVLTVPKITVSVGDKNLVIQDAYQVTGFTTTPDSADISLSIGSDMDLVSRDGFLTKLLDSGIITIELPQGTTKFYVVSADLTDEQLSIQGSIYSPKSQQVVVKTYQNTTLKVILQDLATKAGVECTCLVDGQIDYYRAFDTPIQCIRDLQSSAGFIISYHAGKATFVDVPEEIRGFAEYAYISMIGDTDTEPIRGVYWYDGINQKTAGILDKTAIRIKSVFRSTQNYADKCLRFLRYSANQITVESDINTHLDNHSAVIIRSNDTLINCMAESLEFNWILNTMTAELHYV